MLRASAPAGRWVRSCAANVFTRFNAILGTMLAVIIVVGPIQDGLFGFVLVANALIGIVQELRAKRTLDQLAVLNAPIARVVRDGEVAEVAVETVVLDDLLELRLGDQVPCDGVVHARRGPRDRRVAAHRRERAGREARRATKCCRAASSWRGAGASRRRGSAATRMRASSRPRRAASSSRAPS